MIVTIPSSLPPALVMSSWSQWASSVYWFYEVPVASKLGGIGPGFDDVIRAVELATRPLGLVSGFEWTVLASGQPVEVIATGDLASGFAGIQMSDLAEVSMNLDLEIQLPGGRTVIDYGGLVYVDWRAEDGSVGSGLEGNVGIVLSFRTAAHAFDGPRLMSDNSSVAALNAGGLAAFFEAVRRVPGARFVEATHSELQGPNGYLDVSSDVRLTKDECLRGWRQVLADPTQLSPSDVDSLEDLFELGPTAAELSSALAGLPGSADLVARAQAVLDAVNRPTIAYDGADILALAEAHILELQRLADSVGLGRLLPVDPLVEGWDTWGNGSPERDTEYRLVEALFGTTAQHTADRAYRSACRTGFHLLDLYMWSPLSDLKPDLSSYFQLWRRGFDCRVTGATAHLWRRQLYSYLA